MILEINWFGRNCFRISERGHTSVVTDPHKPAKGTPEPKLRADLVTVSHELSRHNVEQVKDHSYVISARENMKLAICLSPVSRFMFTMSKKTVY